MLPLPIRMTLLSDVAFPIRMTLHSDVVMTALTLALLKRTLLRAFGMLPWSIRMTTL